MASTDSDDDEAPQLSLDALDALKEFYKERDDQLKKFEDLKAQAEADLDAKEKLTMDTFQEDWNHSQFWYNDETATIFARQLLDGATDDTHIAVVSAPSTFIQLKNLLASGEYSCRPQIKLLEFDERFAVFKEFVHYDFANPMKLPMELRGSFHRITADPPFLSQDCQTKTALTVRWLAKSWTPFDPSNKAESFHLFVSTGERMENIISKLYAKTGLRTTTFEPKHKNGLSNEFQCCANFECEDWTWTN